jgi:signal transduction histidine kinase
VASFPSLAPPPIASQSTRGERPASARPRSGFPPAFVREVATEPFRAKLLTGIFTGYATVAVFFVLAIAMRIAGVLPGGDWPFALLGLKLVTNSLAGLAWRTRRLVISLSTLNITADVVLMTAAVYYTGGVLSPLVAIYFIEVAVMALLTNVGLTVTVVAGSFVSYASMVVMVHVGILDPMPPLAGSLEEVTTPLVIGALALMGFTTFGPGIYVALIVDQLRKSERALEARAAELVEASRTKGEFTANITHELRTPLHGIMGMGELIEEGVYGDVTPQQVEAVQTIRKSARGLLELIDALLVLARAEALKLEVVSAPVDLAEVVASVVATGRMVVGGRGLTLSADVAADLPTVETDRKKLVQILVNLLANAIKFTPDEGEVKLIARAADGGVVIEVIDTGTGIPADDLSRIFEPYVQADGSPVREHGGAGIGLSVVKTLADLLGIEVVVVSELGKGSTFSVRIPTAGAVRGDPSAGSG